MSLGNVFEGDLASLIFNGTAIANLADNAATAPLTDLYVSLHTADPGEAGNQSTSEATYTSYARVAVARTSGGWSLAGGAVSNAVAVAFAKATGGSETLTHASIGTAATGTGKIVSSGALTTSVVVSSGVQPNFPIGDLTLTFD